MLVKTALVFNYWINYQYYSKVLCENKNKPMLHCNGKCALSKELDKAEQAQEQSEQTMSLIGKLVMSDFLTTSIFETPFMMQELPGRNWSAFYCDHYSLSLLVGVFRPPISA